MRKTRLLIDTARLRQLYEPLFLSLLGDYLPGLTSERAVVRELTGNLLLRWFVGMDLDQQPWNRSTFSQNRKRRFTKSGCSNGCLMKPWRWRSSRSWSPIIRPWMACYTVNGLMENRHHLLLRINIESFRGLASEMEGAYDLLNTFNEKHALRIQTVGTDKGYFAKPFLTVLFQRCIQPHIAAKTTGREVVHQRIRRMNQTAGYHLSQRAR